MDRRDRWAQNPFFVLNVPPDAGRADVERATQKLIGLLGVGASAALKYATPFGDRPRTEDDVRAAAAELRDPAKRLIHELWAAVPEAIELDAGEVTRWESALADVGLAPEGVTK